MDIAIVLIFLFVVMPLGLFFTLKPMFNDMKIRNGVDNTDFHMCHYAFALNNTYDQAIRLLSARNVTDAMDYQFDPQKMTIDFSNNTESLKYRLTFYIIDGNTHLLVSKMNKFHGRTHIPYLINRFFVEKLGAAPVDYSAFEKRISVVANSVH